VTANNRARRRPKVTATLDPELLAAVDAHVAAHPELDRSAVIDEALRLWRTRELERAMEKQFAEPDGVKKAERAAWDVIRRGAADRRLRSIP
jgi:Arc/MetJ-type ribon-helix-helix transcriptional regulator